MEQKYDVVIVGTGTAGYTAAYKLKKGGKTVAMIDKQPYGGTCAIRGCQPKKYLVAAAEAVERAAALQGKALGAPPAMIWEDLMRSKNLFTDPVPQKTEAGFRKAGMDTYHGEAAFSGPRSLTVGEDELSADEIIVAAGALPRPLDIPGRELAETSDDFLNLKSMPASILFIGGGYISFEFAHVAVRAGARVTIVHRSARPLPRFDGTLVERLVAATQAAGIQVVTDMPVVAIEKVGEKRRVIAGKDRQEAFEADRVFHGAGRVPDIAALTLEKGNVRFTDRGITVNRFMQSVSNPAVYAIGDAADTPLQLAPAADMEALVAARNIAGGNRVAMDYRAVPSVVFTLPPLASVGMTETEAEKKGIRFTINAGDASGWPSSLRIGQAHAFYKVLIEPESRMILGAHLLGHNASEMINIFAMAMKFNLKADDLKSVLWAYPTHISDIKYMV